MSRKNKKVDLDQLKLFEDLASYTNDDEWKAILLDMSKGSFLPNFTFNNNKLIYKHNGKQTYIRLSNNADVAVKEIIKFMNQKNVKTMQEISNKQRINEEKLQKNWASIKSENMQRYYINEFVDTLGELKDIPLGETKRIRTEVFLDFMDEKLDPSCVDFQKGRIVRIKNYTLMTSN